MVIVLLVAKVIALAAVTGGMVSGFSNQLQDPAPLIYIDSEYDEDVGDAAEESGQTVDDVNEKNIDEVVTLDNEPYFYT